MWVPQVRPGSVGVGLGLGLGLIRSRRGAAARHGRELEYLTGEVR